MSDMETLQSKIVETITRYGRPPTPQHHLEKLGEEFGELTAQMALAGPNSSWLEQQAIVDEAIDMINVLISLVDSYGHNVDARLIWKMMKLEQRMKEGRYDRKWGPTIQKPT